MGDKTVFYFNFRFPFYYEVKILLLIWLISPVSRGSLGSSIIYRKFVHPALMKREDVRNFIAYNLSSTLLKLYILVKLAKYNMIIFIMFHSGNRSYDASSSRARIQVLSTIWRTSFYICQQLCDANSN